MKTYLGDGAYAELVDGQLVLTAEDGRRATDRVVLGSEELLKLLDWLRRQGVKV